MMRNESPASVSARLADVEIGGRFVAAWGNASDEDIACHDLRPCRARRRTGRRLVTRLVRGWAQWRLGDHAAPRPEAAPASIPAWAWQRLALMSERNKHLQNAAPKTPAPAPTVSLSAAEQSLADAVNAARVAAGLPALRIDARLETAARAHTQELLDDDLFTHDFAKAGVSYPFDTRISWYLPGLCAGENLAEAGTLAADESVQLWLGSPEHRANLLSPSYTRMGVELAGENGVTIAANEFGC
jgi:uncharacterized protein YkwD